MTETTLFDRSVRRASGTAWWVGGVVGALVVWAALYIQLVPFSEWLVSLLPVDRKSHLGEAIAFFMKQMTRKAPIPDDLVVRDFPVRTRSADGYAARRTIGTTTGGVPRGLDG